VCATKRLELTALIKKLISKIFQRIEKCCQQAWKTGEASEIVMVGAVFNRDRCG
jgi:hypothetical protein